MYVYVCILFFTLCNFCHCTDFKYYIRTYTYVRACSINKECFSITNGTCNSVIIFSYEHHYVEESKRVNTAMFWNENIICMLFKKVK